MASTAMRRVNVSLRVSIRRYLAVRPAYHSIPWIKAPQTTFQLRPSSTSAPFFTQEKPRTFPTSGFEIIEADKPLEEEQLFDYSAYRYYPAHIGEVFQERYQVCSKLGWGSCSTTWLARDLKFVGSKHLSSEQIADSRSSQRAKICRLEGIHPQLSVPP